MKIKTRDFGEMELEESDIIEFVQPLLGFERYHRFALIHNAEIGASIAWLQSLEEAEICFILIDPSELASFYVPQPPRYVADLLGEGELVCWVIGVVPAEFKKTTLNLKSPIIINLNTHKGAQVILEQDYPVRYALMKGADESC